MGSGLKKPELKGLAKGSGKTKDPADLLSTLRAMKVSFDRFDEAINV